MLKETDLVPLAAQDLLESGVQGISVSEAMSLIPIINTFDFSFSVLMHSNYAFPTKPLVLPIQTWLIVLLSTISKSKIAQNDFYSTDSGVTIVAGTLSNLSEESYFNSVQLSGEGCLLYEYQYKIGTSTVHLKFPAHEAFHITLTFLICLLARWHTWFSTLLFHFWKFIFDTKSCRSFTFIIVPMLHATKLQCYLAQLAVRSTQGRLTPSKIISAITGLYIWWKPYYLVPHFCKHQMDFYIVLLKRAKFLLNP